MTPRFCYLLAKASWSVKQYLSSLTVGRRSSVQSLVAPISLAHQQWSQHAILACLASMPASLGSELTVGHGVPSGLWVPQKK